MANWRGRAAEMAAAFMIGDGLLGLAQPRRHVTLWERDAAGAERLVAPFREHPNRRRVYGVMQIAAGLWIASRQRDREAVTRSRGRPDRVR